MILNLRGGLGNQIIQIGYALKNYKHLNINTSAVELREQLINLKGARYINSKILSLIVGSIRKITSYLLDKPTDVCIFNICDGYFQYTDITNILPKSFQIQIKKQIYVDSSIDNIDIVIHIRGGDYLNEKEANIYEKCELNYYINALYKAREINRDIISKVYIVSNDKKYANYIVEAF